jgi:thioredoxin-like negative regulator of GroEL
MSDLISTLSSIDKLLLLLGTSTCSICEQIDQKLRSTEFILGNNFHYRKKNIDEFPILKGHFMVFSAPTILFLENGKETYRKAGVFSLEQTIYELENHIFNQIQDPNVNLY